MSMSFPTLLGMSNRFLRSPKLWAFWSIEALFLMTQLHFYFLAYLLWELCCKEQWKYNSNSGKQTNHLHTQPISLYITCTHKKRLETAYIWNCQMMPLSIRSHMGDMVAALTQSVYFITLEGTICSSQSTVKVCCGHCCGEIVPYYMWVELCRRWVNDDIFFFSLCLSFLPGKYLFCGLVGLGGRDLIVHIFLIRLECFRTRLGYCHPVHFTLTFLFSFCSYFGNALIQHCNFMKSLYENKTAKNTLTRNVSLHVYYASLKQSRKQPSEASWSTWKKNIHSNYIHSNKVLWALLYIWNKCHQPTMYMLQIWQ